MNAKEYLEMALGGNMNVSTFTLSAWEDLLESYAKIKVKESGRDEMLEVLKEVDKYGYDFSNWSNVEKIVNRYK